MGGGGGGGSSPIYFQSTPAPDPQKLIDEQNQKAKDAAEAERMKRIKSGGLYNRVNQGTNVYAELGSGQDAYTGVQRTTTLGG
jgi:hypothetical protein